MRFIVKYFPEITIKSPPVRKRFTKQLQRNLKTRLKSIIDEPVEIERSWDRMTIKIGEGLAESKQDSQLVMDVLATTPGIAYYAKTSVFQFESFEQLCDTAANYWRDYPLVGTFCVRVKRTGKHEFSSTDVERMVGGHVLHFEHNKNVSVKLKYPDEVLRLEITDNQCYVIHQQCEGGRVSMNQT